MRKRREGESNRVIEIGRNRVKYLGTKELRQTDRKTETETER